MTVQEMKELACKAIDENSDKILSLAKSIYEEPEFGYKEYKTAEKIKKVFDELGLTYEDEVVRTGIVTPLKGKHSNARVAIMGEMDAIPVPNHKDADRSTGAAHCCGHNTQAASVVGVAYALAKTGIMEHLDGDVVLMHVPAEEAIEMDWRDELIDSGEIAFVTGKQEFLRRGEFDGIDMMLIQHVEVPDRLPHVGILGTAGGPDGWGVLQKSVQYVGKPAHVLTAGKGVNALNAAQIGLTAIQYQRETFQDEDGVRVHYMMTKGGDVLNIVPDDVRLDVYVRATNVAAMKDASEKVNRALQAGAMAVGAECHIKERTLCMCPLESQEMKDICYNNLKYVFGEDSCIRDGRGISGDANDISHIVPTVQFRFAGVSGALHSENFEMTNMEIPTLDAAKVMVCSAIDLLSNGAEKALYVKEHFKPTFTKESYLDWCGVKY